MLVRTTLQPAVVLDVDPREFWRLAQLGIVLEDWRALYANFYLVPGGPPDDTVTALSVTVRNSGNSVVLTGSGTDIQHVTAGAWLYQVPPLTTLPFGTYTVTWTGTDGDGDQVEAVETVTVGPDLSPPNSPSDTYSAFYAATY